jgi:hypothetical protein
MNFELLSEDTLRKLFILVEEAEIENENLKEKKRDTIYKEYEDRIRSELGKFNNVYENTNIPKYL